MNDEWAKDWYDDVGYNPRPRYEESRYDGPLG